ncbi:MAG: hypothetical protein RLZZ39_1175, partial [Actinomycetota bacterium]
GERSGSRHLRNRRCRSERQRSDRETVDSTRSTFRRSSRERGSRTRTRAHLIRRPSTAVESTLGHESETPPFFVVSVVVACRPMGRRRPRRNPRRNSSLSSVTSVRCPRCRAWLRARTRRLRRRSVRLDHSTSTHCRLRCRVSRHDRLDDAARRRRCRR